MRREKPRARCENNVKERGMVHDAVTVFLLIVLTAGCRGPQRDVGPDKKPGVENPQVRPKTPPASSAAPEMTQLALDEAALAGNLPLVRQGVEQGLDVNGSASEGRTPLMLASFNGHTGVASYLLEHGSKINLKDTAGRTALMYASSGPYHETVEVLIKSGAEVNAVDGEEKWTALMFAAGEGQTEVVKVLLNSGADPTLKDADGDTALDFAQKRNQRAVVELLRTK